MSNQTKIHCKVQLSFDDKISLKELLVDILSDQLWAAEFQLHAE